MDQLITQDPTHIGPYRLIARLGAGGMGLVYLGRSEAGRTVAVKVVQAEHAAHPEFRRRFAREVAAARRVGGAWTADVLDADTDAAVPWVATQYIPGPDLTTVVAKDFGPLPESSVRVLAHRLAEALTAVHGAGLIHRDLKPSNVLVTVDGPRVIDFGIARAMDSLTSDSLLTHTGMLIGSPGFMSPEQVRGLELTPASDVFCLGAVLVYAATGRLLFGAGTTGLNAHLFRIAEEEPDLTGVPEGLLPLVRECLHKDPSQRPTPASVMERTAGTGAGEWLPGTVLAQLGRHAAQLLDFAPETRVPAAQPQVPAQAPAPRPQVPARPPAYTPTTPADGVPQGFGPAQGFGPPPVPVGPPAPYGPADDVPGRHPQRWKVLTWAALAQLLVLLTWAVSNAAQNEQFHDLDISSSYLDWGYYAQVAAFGGLLIAAGHLADRIGRKPMLLTGLASMAAAAVLDALAPSAIAVAVSLGLQGAAAALISAAALGLVAAHFTEARERARAFGVYVLVAIGGEAFVLLPSDALAEAVTWRISFFLIAILALVVLAGVAARVHDLPLRRGGRFDLPGVLLAATAMAVLAYGLRKGPDLGWGDPTVLTTLGGGVVLLVVFLWAQTRTSAALLPPYVLRDRDRIAAVCTLLLAGFAMNTLVPAVNTYLRSLLGLSALGAGAALIPLAGAVAVGALMVVPQLHLRAGPRALIAPGLLLAALGLFLLRAFPAVDSYALGLLPGLLLAGFGLGLALAPLFTTATRGLAAQDAGGGAGAVLTGQQLGFAAGSSMLTTFFMSDTDELTHVYGPALAWSASGMLLAALVSLLITARDEAAGPRR
ncbi:MFS transporter [Streptomyces sp. YC504]|uniref:MFS transporter n=1 Tax=Streptomyces mesophilus TaxID=1775132 RepID=A0A6G4XKU2_9ACTN|nr:MFS transporter [Streptomyces mesophilus]NGO77792.1 MFS transporter [Streptomyces mesophilus]